MWNQSRCHRTLFSAGAMNIPDRPQLEGLDGASPRTQLVLTLPIPMATCVLNGHWDTLLLPERLTGISMQSPTGLQERALWRLDKRDYLGLKWLRKHLGRRRVFGPAPPTAPPAASSFSMSETGALATFLSRICSQLQPASGDETQQWISCLRNTDDQVLIYII